nr:hypothetical protein [Tanacetum cinerariifolium]
MEPKDSIIIGNEELSTIPEKELDEVKKSSVENLVSIPKGKSVTFSNPIFDSNDDFTSSDDESLSDEDVPEDKVKIYSNPLFKFDDVYISSDVNPLFDEVLENIENKDSYDSNLDEPDLLVTPLSDANKDECLDLGGDVDEIELLLYHDLSTPKMSVASILEGFTDEPPLEENDDLFDLESKENKWKKILYDAPVNDLMIEDKVFDPGILKKKISPTYVITIIFSSHMSEDTIFNPDIFAFLFSLELVTSRRSGTFMCFNVYLNILNESPMEICFSICFVPNITMIWGTHQGFVSVVGKYTTDSDGSRPLSRTITPITHPISPFLEDQARDTSDIYLTRWKSQQSYLWKGRGERSKAQIGGLGIKGLDESLKTLLRL